MITQKVTFLLLPLSRLALPASLSHWLAGSWPSHEICERFIRIPSVSGVLKAKMHYYLLNGFFPLAVRDQLESNDRSLNGEYWGRGVCNVRKCNWFHARDKTRYFAFIGCCHIVMRERGIEDLACSIIKRRGQYVITF